MKVAGYGRVSTVHQAEDGTSSDEQKRIIHEECQRKGWRLIDFYSDDGFSGKNIMRPGMLKLLSDAKKKLFDTVVFTKLDRFGRSLRDILNTLNELSELGIRVYCINQPEINSDGASGKLLLQMLAAVAEFERRLILERTAQGKQSRARKGMPGTGRVPHGRRFNKDTNSWEIDAKAQEKIQKAAKRYLEDDISMEKLAKEFGMNQMNLRQILVKTAGSDFTQTLTKLDGTKTTFTTKVPPLLDDLTMQMIREKAEIRVKWDRTKRKNDYLLGGKIIDEETGLSLTGSHVFKTGRRFYYFNKNGVRYSVDADMIENAVWRATVNALSDSQTLYNAVFDGKPKESMMNYLLEKREALFKDIKTIDARAENIGTLVEFYDKEDRINYIKTQAKKLKELSNQKDSLLKSVALIEHQIKEIPTEKEIETYRQRMQQELEKSYAMSSLSTGNAFDDLSYDEQQRLINMIYRGKDADGKRYGVYIRRGEGDYRFFVAYGMLGNFRGSLNKEGFDSDYIRQDADGEIEMTEKIAKEFNLLYTHDADKVTDDLPREII